MSELPLADLIACVERELEHRAYVYPARVARRLIEASEAATEVQQMQAVLEILRELHEIEFS